MMMNNNKLEINNDYSFIVASAPFILVMSIFLIYFSFFYEIPTEDKEFYEMASLLYQSPSSKFVALFSFAAPLLIILTIGFANKNNLLPAAVAMTVGGMLTILNLFLLNKYGFVVFVVAMIFLVIPLTKKVYKLMRHLR